MNAIPCTLAELRDHQRRRLHKIQRAMLRDSRAALSTDDGVTYRLAPQVLTRKALDGWQMQARTLIG